MHLQVVLVCLLDLGLDQHHQRKQQQQKRRERQRQLQQQAQPSQTASAPYQQPSEPEVRTDLSHTPRLQTSLQLAQSRSVSYPQSPSHIWPGL